MKINVEEMSLENLKDIFEFEVQNRVYFERTLPPRPEDYFDYASFQNLMIGFLEEQMRGECAMFVLRDLTGEMVGRINLTAMTYNGERKAELGYRIGEVHQGKGYASEAVSAVVDMGYQVYGLNKIEAGTSTENIGSQRVLEKNGFIRVATMESVMEINGSLVDGYCYEKERQQ
ncbi:MAG: GNAT family N-acetyltransferase [Clostridia bacterium]|nr:GNAT family N-acetyltransferase [Clostridia bacterium]